MRIRAQTIMTTRRILNKDSEPHNCTLNADGVNEELFNTSKISALDNKASYADTLKAELLNRVEIAEEKRLNPINFNGIIGHLELKEEILYAVKAKIANNERSKLYLKSIDSHAVTGILIYGLPGIGKTDVLRMVGESVKDHPDIECKYMACSDFQGNVGTNASQIDKVFDEARNTTKKICIMLIDEIDSVMMAKRGHVNVAERTNAMQSNMDGMKDSSKIIVIATTNRVNGMENASISRFTRINLELPTYEERKEFIIKYISPIPSIKPIHIDSMAKTTEGFTGRMFRDMGMKLDRIEVVTGKPITEEDITKTILKYVRVAGKNTKQMNEDEDGNSLNNKTPSIISKDNVTNKSAFSYLDSDKTEQSRLEVK